MKNLLAVLLILTGAVSAHAQQGAVRCGKLLEVRSGKLLSDQVVLFENGKITAIGPVAFPPGPLQTRPPAPVCGSAKDHLWQDSPG